MGLPADAFESPYWRRGVTVLAVTALHVLAFVGLLMTRIVDTARTDHQSVLTLVMLPPLAVKPVPSRPGRKGLKNGPAALPEYRWIVPGAPGDNAITILRILPYMANGQPSCPSYLKPGTPEWEKRCPAQAGHQDMVGEEDFSLVPRGALAFQRWEAERKARNKPFDVPCTYTQTEKLPGGPFERTSAMVNVGCAVGKLFGH